MVYIKKKNNFKKIIEDPEGLLFMCGVKLGPVR